MAVGASAGDALTIGASNVSLGVHALGAEDVGDRSVAVGAHSLGLQNSNTDNEVR